MRKHVKSGGARRYTLDTEPFTPRRERPLAPAIPGMPRVRGTALARDLRAGAYDGIPVTRRRRPRKPPQVSGLDVHDRARNGTVLASETWNEDEGDPLMNVKRVY